MNNFFVNTALGQKFFVVHQECGSATFAVKATLRKLCFRTPKNFSNQ